MTQITFLASSKPLILPDEITDNRREEEEIYFTVHEIDSYWLSEIEGLFTMPYIYEAFGVGNRLFLTFIERYMEFGDVLEVYHVPNQHGLDKYIQRMKEDPEPVEVNVGSHTYRYVSGFYQLNPKKWVEELSHRNYLTHFGITTFVKY